ncbi:MAG: zinc ribbon domain-containing protein [Thermoplasmatales archaeon]|nr:zinc ribbon domain-containing protein [Thermoplasmatales archaeon]
MYCQKCGKEIVDGVRFCAACGAEQTQGYASPRVVYTEKSAGIAILLGLILVGAGQMYVGKIGRGIAFLLIGLILYPAFIVPLFFMPSTTGLLVGIAIISLVAVVYAIYVLYDAYSLAKEYNAYLRTNGQPPW